MRRELLRFELIEQPSRRLKLVRRTYWYDAWIGFLALLIVAMVIGLGVLGYQLTQELAANEQVEPLKTNILAMLADVAVEQELPPVAEQALNILITPTFTPLPTHTSTSTSTMTPVPTETPIPTQTPKPTSTRTATATQSPTRTYTPTHTSTPEPTATETLSPTPTPKSIQVAVNQNANIRRGPGTDYEVVVVVRAGEQVEVVGQNESGTWVILKDGGWIATFLLDRPTEDLPVVTPEVTP